MRRPRTTPYVCKNPAYDSYSCECGARLRSKTPNVIEGHKNTRTHQQLISSSLSASASPAGASVPPPSVSS